MRRGEIWTFRDDRYASKARPVLIVQNDTISLDSVILCLLTSFDRPASPYRVMVEPDDVNGLFKTSFVMADKPVTVRRDELGTRVGSLTDDQMSAVSAALALTLAITGPGD